MQFLSFLMISMKIKIHKTCVMTNKKSTDLNLCFPILLKIVYFLAAGFLAAGFFAVVAAFLVVATFLAAGFFFSAKALGS